MARVNEQADPVKEIEELDWLRQDIIDQQAMVSTPYGDKPLLYADYTARGRSLRSVENFVQSLLPYYANTILKMTIPAN